MSKETKPLNLQYCKIVSFYTLESLWFSKTKGIKILEGGRKNENDNKINDNKTASFQKCEKEDCFHPLFLKLWYKENFTFESGEKLGFWWFFFQGGGETWERR